MADDEEDDASRRRRPPLSYQPLAVVVSLSRRSSPCLSRRSVRNYAAKVLSVSVSLCSLLPPSRRRRSSIVVAARFSSFDAASLRSQSPAFICNLVTLQSSGFEEGCYNGGSIAFVVLVIFVIDGDTSIVRKENVQAPRDHQTKYVTSLLCTGLLHYVTMSWDRKHSLTCYFAITSVIICMIKQRS